jgi:hypothetical protein
MYMTEGSPFSLGKNGMLLDSAGRRVELMADSKAILDELATDQRWKDTAVVRACA